MKRETLLSLSQKLYGLAESIKEEYGLTDEEIKEILEEVIKGF